MSYRPNQSYRPNRRRAVAVAQSVDRRVDWRAATAAALTLVVSAGLWICLASAADLLARLGG
jgi:hypothetical protein